MTLFAALAIPVRLSAQEQGDNSAMATANPVPLISQPLLPDAIRPGAAGFTLTVNGTGFVSGSVVKWNGSVQTTKFVSRSQLKATVLASDLAKASTSSVTVVNPGPGGGTSNVVFFEITTPTASVALSTTGIRAGSGPLSVAVGDFNRDGKLDLAVANAGSNNISVLLGKGDGTFKAAVNYGAGSGPSSVAVGDFNRDGKLDLAVANNGGNISILLGNGDGTFRATVNYATGNSPSSVAVGDFNRDGKLDLAVANSGASNGVSNISVLLGRGDGTFQPAVNYNAGFGSLSVAVGDFDGDGNLDLAVASFGSSDVNVLRGDGDGTFNAAVSYAADAPTSVAVGDFNGDGKLDLVVANIVTNQGFGNVGVLLGNGDGTFQAAVDYGVGSNPYSVAVGDFNSDGKPDLAVANGGYGNGLVSVSVLLGNGDGTFQSAVDYDAGSSPSSVAVGDFNGDGRLDMAVGDGASGTSMVSVLLQPPLVIGPNAILEPTGLIFPTQLVDTTSATQSAMLSNYGTTTLSLTSITTSGDFSHADTCGPSLAAGASCAITVAFKPTEGGTRTGTLTVTDNAPGSPQRVSLSGTGTVVELNPTSLQFSCIRICLPVLGCHCDCTPSKTTTLTNVGSAALSITSVTITGPFGLGNACPKNLGARQSCTLSVTWSRLTGGGEIFVNDNGGGSPQTVSLFGNRQCSP